MTPFINDLELGRTPLDTVVVLGAGDGSSLEAIIDASPHRLIAVEGDPQTGADLQLWAARRSTVESHVVALTADGDVTPWYRYNLSWLNGTVDRQSLKNVYPRLQLLSRSVVPSVAFGSWLGERQVDASAAQSNLLVMDVPGIAAGLLKGLDPADMQRFHRIVVSHCSRDGEPWVSAADELLLAAGFELDRMADGATSLWVVRLYRFDARAWRLRNLQTDCERLRARAAAAEADAASERRRADDATREAEALGAGVRAERESEERRAVERIDGLTAGLHAALRRAAQQDAHAYSLKQELQRELDAARSELTAERQRATEIAAMLRARDAEIHALRADLAEVTRQRDAVTTQVAAWDTALASIEAAELREQRVREELTRAEAQIDLIKDLLFREPRA